MAEETDAQPEKRSLGNLAMIWRFAARYPGQDRDVRSRAAGGGAGDARHSRRFPAGDRPRLRGRGGDVSTISIICCYRHGPRPWPPRCAVYFVSLLGERVVADIRSAVQDNLLRLEPRFFEENRPSEIASRLTADTSVIEMVVGATVSVALRNIVMGLGGIVYLFTLAPALTATLLLGIPLVIGPIVLLGPQGARRVAAEPGPDRRCRRHRLRDPRAR
jgi:ATP-binding cassette subfamily B protein